MCSPFCSVYVNTMRSISAYHFITLLTCCYYHLLSFCYINIYTASELQLIKINQWVKNGLLSYHSSDENKSITSVIIEFNCKCKRWRELKSKLSYPYICLLKALRGHLGFLAPLTGVQALDNPYNQKMFIHIPEFFGAMESRDIWHI